MTFLLLTLVCLSPMLLLMAWGLIGCMVMTYIEADPANKPVVEWIKRCPLGEGSGVLFWPLAVRFVIERHKENSR